MKTHLKTSIIKGFFICLAFLPVRAFSQLTDWVNYTNGDRVTKLLNDGEYLWVTTYGGLTKLTKSTSEMLFYTKAQGGLPSNSLESVAKDQDGMLWIVSHSDGIGKFDGTKTEIYNRSNSGFSSINFFDVTIDKDNNPWFASLYFLLKKEGDEWKRWRGPGMSIESHNSIHQLEFDEEGVLWLAGSAYSWAFAKFEGDTVLSLPGFTGFDKTGNGLESDNGAIWLASSDGLFRYKDEDSTVFNTSNSQVPSNVFHDVKKDGAGNLWIACSGYLLKYDGNEFESFKLPFGAADFVASLETDGDSVVWMGTNANGLYQFKEGVFTPINVSNSGLTTNMIGTTMVMDSKNNIWFNTHNELMKINADNQWTRCIESENQIRLVGVDPLDQVWATLPHGDTCVVKISPEGTTAFTTGNSPLPADSDNFICFHFDRKGNAWFGTTKGLFRYDGKDWDCFTPENSPLESALINCLTADADDNLWGGSDGCLFKYDDTDWEIYTSRNSGMPSDRVIKMAIDTKDEILWLSCGNGLTRFDGMDWFTYQTGNSDIPSHQIHDIEVDKAGHVWLATNAGITRFDGSKWIVYTAANSGMSYNDVSKITLDYYRDRIWMNHRYGYGISSAKAEWGVSAISEIKTDDPAVFTLYPNPATTEVHVQCKADLTGTISVCDISGKTLSRTTLKGNCTFSLQELGIAQDGLYLVQLITSQGKYSKKLIVRK